MKRISIAVFCAAMLFISACPSWADAIPKISSDDLARINELGARAQVAVKNLPSKHGGTVDNYLTMKAAAPAIEDLGWFTQPLTEGGYQVERILILNKTMKMIYRWRVSLDGKTAPENGKAISITKE